MKIIDGNRRRLQCKAGEVITISVTSSGTVHNVATSLDAATLTQDSFTVNDRRDLVILGVFSNDTGGGSYDIKLTSDQGGDVVIDDIVQGEGNVARKEGSRGYIFTVI